MNSINEVRERIEAALNHYAPLDREDLRALLNDHAWLLDERPVADLEQFRESVQAEYRLATGRWGVGAISHAECMEARKKRDRLLALIDGQINR